MKNIIFDLGGVILREKPISILDNFNIEQNVYDELKKFFDDWKDLDLGKESLEEKYNSCNFSKEIERGYKDILLNYYKYREFNKDIIVLINILKSKDYNIYILSDNNKECFNYCKNHELLKNVDNWIVSCEYGVSKRDGKLFDVLIDKYNLNPSECYLVDDKPQNIEKANSFGINGYIFNENDDINLLYENMKNEEISF